MLAWLHYQRSVERPAVVTDYDGIWIAGRALLSGAEPYDAVAAAALKGPQGYHLYYPLTAVVAMLPLTLVSLNAARAIFTGASAGLLCYGLWRRGWWALPALLTPTYLHAYYNSQWTPLLTSAALLPAVGAVLAAKPTTGLAIAAMRPTRWMAAGGAVLLLLSFALRPDWLGDWVATVQSARQYSIPVLRPWGWVLLVAGLAWRTPEGRFLLGLSLVPGNPYPTSCSRCSCWPARDVRWRSSCWPTGSLWASAST